ncbi:hypothetical protein BD626DRAFT_367867, partial [Schizophyllum amplum]
LAADMEELFEHVEAQFQRMSDKYDKKVQYFQELFYQRGLHSVHRREKTNAFNAFKSTIAANRREEGLPGLTVAQIAADEDYMKQYHDMTEEERTAMIDEHDKTKDRQTNAIRLSGKARYQDATFVFGQITTLIQGLRDRVGVEGFCVLVRREPSFYMKPLIYFTRKEVEDYMPIAVPRWDSVKVATLLESFAILGCNPDST